jgi:hypothetical protein
MAGNLQQWCWDWGGTPYGGGDNPRGLALFHAWAERAMTLFEDVDGAAIIP